MRGGRGRNPKRTLKGLRKGPGQACLEESLTEYLVMAMNKGKEIPALRLRAD
jgi:hypothetical protein